MTEMFQFNPYAILDISEKSNLSDIQDAYEAIREHLLQVVDTNRAAKAQLEMVHEAYQILSNPIQRKKFDEWLEKNPVNVTNQFALRLTPSKRVVKPLGEEQVIYLLAEMLAPNGVTERMKAREVHLNLTLIIDQSRSMDDGGRMRRVIAAAQTIISNLTQNDVISVVSFNDRASVIIPATPVTDTNALRTRLGMIKPRGGTEIFQGLSAGMVENRKYLDPKKVNHVILLTDGRTYGDEQKCLDLAQKAASEGISISAMGLGADWNDVFLDKLASATGGTSTFIKSVNMVSDFMEAQLRHLSNAFAERMHLSIAMHPSIQLEMAFKISPNAQPIEINDMQLPLASLQGKRSIGVLLQLLLPADLPAGFFNIGRFVASGDIMLNNAQTHYAVSHMTVDISDEVSDEVPPPMIVDALSKLTLYRLQEKAQKAMEDGDIAEATRHLEHLATRLLEMGQDELGHQAMAEVSVIKQTRAFSNEETKKTIKYNTRALIDPKGMKGAITTLFEDDVQNG